MTEFWTEFDARLARLEWEHTELGDNLAAWDEIPDASEKFVACMTTAHIALGQAIRWMKAARELEAQS
jgi:hypothetical protein